MSCVLFNCIPTWIEDYGLIKEKLNWLLLKRKLILSTVVSYVGRIFSVVNVR